MSEYLQVDNGKRYRRNKSAQEIVTRVSVSERSQENEFEVRIKVSFTNKFGGIRNKQLDLQVSHASWLGRNNTSQIHAFQIPTIGEGFSICSELSFGFEYVFIRERGWKRKRKSVSAD